MEGSGEKEDYKWQSEPAPPAFYCQFSSLLCAVFYTMFPILTLCTPFSPSNHCSFPVLPVLSKFPISPCTPLFSLSSLVFLHSPHSLPVLLSLSFVPCPLPVLLMFSVFTHCSLFSPYSPCALYSLPVLPIPSLCSLYSPCALSILSLCSHSLRVLFILYLCSWFTLYASDSLPLLPIISMISILSLCFHSLPVLSILSLIPVLSLCSLFFLCSLLSSCSVPHSLLVFLILSLCSLFFPHSLCFHPMLLFSLSLISSASCSLQVSSQSHRGISLSEEAAIPLGAAHASPCPILSCGAAAAGQHTGPGRTHVLCPCCLKANFDGVSLP